MSNSNKKQRLALAAEALVEAASLEVDSMTQKKLSSSLEALKTSFETELTAVTKSVKASNEHFDDKINTMKQELTNVRSELTNVRSELQKMHAVLESQAKMKRLELASTRTSILSFDYNNDSGNNTNSSALVKNIIEHFMFGYGYILPQNAFVGSSYHDNTAENKALFRKKLVKQVKDQIGSEPRLQDKGNGAFSIFYS